MNKDFSEGPNAEPAAATSPPEDATAAGADRILRQAAATSQDPALVAALQMLLSAFADEGIPIGRAGCPGERFVVIVPSAEWAEPCAEAWRYLLASSTTSNGGRRRETRTPPAAVFVTIPGEPHEMDRAEDEKALTKAVNRGSLFAAFSPQAAWLPRELATAASQSMQVRFLGPVGLAKLAENLCGGNATHTIEEGQAARVTPYFLRLAKHPLDAADDFLGRLSKLAAGAVATVSHQESAVESTSTATPERAASLRDEPTLDRLHGMDDAVAWGNALRRDLDAYRAGELDWNEVDRGCLVSGPPGCGKTTFARALATTCGVSLYPGSYTTWLARGHGHQGDLMKGMRDTFAQAKRHAPSIVFIDELDSFPNRATVSNHNPEWEIQVVNGLLAEIDGVEQREGVILVGACNFPDKLDPALTRAGRLDRHIHIGLPDSTALARILREHLGEEAGDADVGRAALFLLGSTGADCEAIVRGARRRARNADRAVGAIDLFEEILHADSRSPAELRLAAVHEAGHAAAAVACGFRLEGATIRGRGQSGGVVSTSLGGGVLTADDVELRLCLFLAGRAAEEVFLGKPSGGAGGGPDSDLARATLLATKAVSAWCLDGGFVWAGAPTSATLSRLLRDRPDVAVLVRQTLDKAYDRAVELIRAHRPGIAALADVLLAKGAVRGAEALHLLKQKAGGQVARWPKSSAPRWLMPSPPKVPAARIRLDEQPEHV